MLHDQHCHSVYSKDSKEDLENYFLIACKYQVKYLVTTEHIEFNSVCDHQDWTVDFPHLIKELQNNHQKYPSITPLLGVEIGYRKDHLLEMKKLIQSEPFDVVNMSIHDNGVYDYYFQDMYQEIGVNNMLQIYFNNIIDALDNFDDFDVLSHFDYGFKTAFLVNNDLKITSYEQITRMIFKKLIKLNKALEINLKVQLTINDDNHLKTILRWYKEEGGKKLTLSSDAHKKEAYDNYYIIQKKYTDLIKEAGFNYLCYFIKRVEHHYYL